MSTLVTGRTDNLMPRSIVTVICYHCQMFYSTPSIHPGPCLILMVSRSEGPPQSLRNLWLVPEDARHFSKENSLTEQKMKRVKENYQ